ncbi:MAG TPA: BlaI/MecI/CopY family transcriptional regulator [Sphingobacteriaceae bacterium]
MEIKPTASEMEILQILWQRGSCTVREVNEILTADRGEEVGYTTTLKLMQIMSEKKMVERDTSSRTHVYRAVLNPEQTKQTVVNRFINRVFNGSAAQLVMHAVNKRSSKEEIEEIRKYLDQLDKK